MPAEIAGAGNSGTSSKDLPTLKLLRYALILTASLFPSTLARATTITYNLLATTSAGTLTGTVSINSSTDQITSADLTLNDSALGSPVFTTVSSSTAYNGLSQDYIVDSSSGGLNDGGQIALFFNTANVGTGSLSICTDAIACGTGRTESSLVEVYSTHGHVDLDLSSGTLTPVGTSSSSSPAALTPEPSSLLLLGTGFLGLSLALLVFPLKVSSLPGEPTSKDPA